MWGAIAKRQRRWLTPDATEGDEICRPLFIPDGNLGIAEAVAGALSLLGEPWNWEQSGDMTPAECAEMCAGILSRWYEENCSTSEEMVEAPYWEDAEDSDDEATPEEQPWYGEMEGVTFIESIGIWGITAFIAYSGQIGAALAFKTFAPTFVLAWKTGGVGGAIRVFIDGVDNGLLDTYSASPGTVEKVFVGDPDVEEHEILQVLETLHV